MADPEQYRTREEVASWRQRDPIPAFGDQLLAEGLVTREELERIDAEAIARVDAAVAFAEASPFPEPDALYDDVYVLPARTRGWYSVETTDERVAGPGEADREAAADGAANDEIPQRLTTALMAGEDEAPAGDGSGGERGGGG